MHLNMCVCDSMLVRTCAHACAHVINHVLVSIHSWCANGRVRILAFVHACARTCAGQRANEHASACGCAPMRTCSRTCAFARSCVCMCSRPCWYIRALARHACACAWVLCEVIPYACTSLPRAPQRAWAMLVLALFTQNVWCWAASARCGTACVRMRQGRAHYTCVKSCTCAFFLHKGAEFEGARCPLRRGGKTLG